MIVSRLTRNSVMVCEMFVPRPASMTSTEWEKFWMGRGTARITYDNFRALVFGACIPRPPSVLYHDWEVFWQSRSDRRRLEETNMAAELEAQRRRSKRR